MAVCRLEPVPFEIEHLADSSPSFLQMHLNYVKYKFKCNFAAMMSAEDMPQATTESVSVLFNLKHDGGVYLSSQWEPVPLKIFLRGKEVKLTPEPKAEAEEKDVLFDEMVVAMPWLQHLDKVQGYQASIATSEETPSSSSGQQHVDIFDMDEESLLSASRSCGPGTSS